MSAEARETRLPDYGEFARMIYGTSIISDPWLAGAERFRLRGAVLGEGQAAELYLAAERVGQVYDEVAEVVRRCPELATDFFGLTPYQHLMWLASDGRWHGIARVDLFCCADGRVRACEMNSDTPSGEAEAVILNELLHPYHPGTIDPNAGFEGRFWQMLCASHHAGTPRRAAIIYPTDLPEDLSMIALYRRWLERRGCEVALGSPYNIGLDRSGRLTVFGAEVDLIVRHYKTDWWGEREPIWENQEPYPDPAPLDAALLPLLDAERRGAVTVVNPFGSVLTQNKLSMALMWEHQDLFSPPARAWIREYFPETRRLAAFDPGELPREEWVLKSDYGCEGDSVVCGPYVKPADWRLAQAAAVGRRWVAQRFFEVATDDEGWRPNYGVYLIGGRAAGFYTRLARAATDYTALTTPTFIRPNR